LSWFMLTACKPEAPPNEWPSESATTNCVPSGNTFSGDLDLESYDGTLLDLSLASGSSTGCIGAVVMVAPGLEAGKWMTESPLAEMLLDEGLLVVGWDQRGRGGSSGEEDVGGGKSQEDLAAVLRWTAALDYVVQSQIAVFSRSLGGVTTAGALGRFSDLAPIGWVDFESPGWLKQDLTHSAEHTRSRMNELATGDDWWEERTPVLYMESVTVPYHRLQGVPDHALGDYVDHARAMLDHSTATSIRTYNGDNVELPIGDVNTREMAVDGGINPESREVAEAILRLF